jgi:hypothetical protein
MSATPYRKDFYSKLGSDEEKVQKQMKEWVRALDKNVGVLKEFMKGVKW